MMTRAEGLLSGNWGVAGQTPALTNARPDSGADFGELLKMSIERVGELQQTADSAALDLAAGRHEDIHQTMIAMEKADISFQLMMQIRNKIVAAYEEIMRMQV